ncbi:cell envelope biogenesis protein OmpA [Rubrivivax gelatinosus]|nr:cell envelope biogenesis protein OmpA [Rubrivivax gelatinosus]
MAAAGTVAVAAANTTTTAAANHSSSSVGAGVGVGSVPSSDSGPDPHANARIVVVQGQVSDDATRQAVLARAREVFGGERVADRLGVGAQAVPAAWLLQLQRWLTPALLGVHAGRLELRGRELRLEGEVANEAERRRIAAALGEAPQGWALHTDLRLAEPVQPALDALLAAQRVEFEPASAELTPAGRRVLDGLLPLLQGTAPRRLEIVGHSDAAGAREANLALSQARAEAVRTHLLAQGLAGRRISARGVGPDEPMADDGTPEGRARNRRIRVRLLD